MQFTEDFVNGHVSFWSRDIGSQPRRLSLPGSAEVDVAIVGAGLTGLWTAYYLAQAMPALTIAVLEKHCVGYGASGRNGGWLSGEPVGQFRRYAKTHGTACAKAMQRQMFSTVDEVLRVTSTTGIVADIERAGLLRVATNDAQMQRLLQHVDTLKRQGWGADDVSVLTPPELRERVHVAGARGAFWTPHGARLHPAKFVTGLAAAVERLGVRIYEDTTVDSVNAGIVRTGRGNVKAHMIVRALEGYTDSLNKCRRKYLPMNSSMIVTEVLPRSVWDEIGWSGGELLGDFGHSFAYSQRTTDGRIALGGRGVPYNFASSFSPDGRTATKAITQLVDKLASTFPAVSRSAIQHAWSGVLGVPRDWCAAVNFDPRTGVGSAGGYVGHGLAGANLAARTLRDLMLGDETELTTMPWVGRRSRRWEVEPLRWIGASALYATYRRADRREASTLGSRTTLSARLADTISGR